MSASMEWHGDDVAARIADGTVLGLNVAAEFLLAEAKKQVPFDIGDLSDSGAVEPATSPNEGALVYFDTPYAAHLHEHPEYNFSADANPGAKGKYLEDPAMENREKIRRIIEREVEAQGD